MRCSKLERGAQRVMELINFHSLSASEAARLIREGVISSERLMEACLARVREIDGDGDGAEGGLDCDCDFVRLIRPGGRHEDHEENEEHEDGHTETAEAVDLTARLRRARVIGTVEKQERHREVTSALVARPSR